MINLKSFKEIEIMKKGGKILGDLLDRAILCKILEGVTTKEIDFFIEKFILEHKAIPILKNLDVDGKVYKYSSCISVNKELVHTPPSGRVLLNGDIVSVDVCLKYDGFCLDAARTYPVGEIADSLKELIEVTETSFFKGLAQFQVGNKIGKISNNIESYVLSKGFKVIKDFCGHGIGRELHELPNVPNFGKADEGIVIEEGLAIALEPMVTQSDEFTTISVNGWSAITGSYGAHYENTVIALKEGPLILTRGANV